MTTEQAIFQRTELLLGREALERIGRQRVIVFGVGGVGSWCAESLVRSGVRHLTIVDFDRVDISNVNRQLMATTQSLGQVKVEVLRNRLLTINPAAEITALQTVFNEQTSTDFHLESYDYVIDAIDSLKAKALLIEMACRSGARLFSSMGAAQKIDTTRIGVTEFWKVTGDPLARALRHYFKRQKHYPQSKFLCVFSDELVPNHGDGKVCGTLAHITAIFGFTLAGLLIKDVVKS